MVSTSLRDSRFALGFLAAAIALPWLSPFSSGPSPAVWPQWFGLVCLGLVLVVFLRMGAAAWYGLCAALVALVALCAAGWLEPLTAACLLTGVVMLGAVGLGRGLGAWESGLGGGIARGAELGGVTCGRQGADALPLLSAVAWGLLVAALVSSVLGLVQYFKLEGYLSPWVASSFKGESFANLRQKNQFASLVNLAWFPCAWLAVRSANGLYVGTNLRQWQGRLWLWALAAGLLGMGNAVAASRTGLVQLAIVVVLAAWWGSGAAGLHVRRLWSLAGANVGGYLVGSLALPWLVVDGASIVKREAMGGEGCFSRLNVWRNVWELVVQRPWGGWGWGRLDETHYLGSFEPRFCDILDNAHNLPLHLAVELGLPVAVLVCSAIAWFMLKTWVPRGGFGARHMAWGMAAVVLLHSLLEYPLWYAPFQTAFALAVGLLWPLGAAKTAASGPNGPDLLKNPSNMPFVQYPRHLFAIILGLILTGVAWDYWRVSQIYKAPEQRARAFRDDTMAKIQGSWLFRDQVAFAKLSIMPVVPDNAAEQLARAQALLAYSPEPRVIEKLLEAALMLGRADLVALHLRQFEAAFPDDFKRWTAAQAAKKAPEALK